MELTPQDLFKISGAVDCHYIYGSSFGSFFDQARVYEDGTIFIRYTNPAWTWYGHRNEMHPEHHAKLKQYIDKFYPIKQEISK